MSFFFVSVPFVLAATFLCAAEEREKNAPQEWVATLGCQKRNFEKETGSTENGPAAKIAGKVYLLKGNVPKDYYKGGEWLITGYLNPDGKSVTVVKMKKNE